MANVQIILTFDKICIIKKAHIYGRWQSFYKHNSKFWFLLG